MTRDEAIDFIGGLKGFPYMHGTECGRWIDVFAALGMLNLDDEPAQPSPQATAEGTDG